VHVPAAFGRLPCLEVEIGVGIIMPVDYHGWCIILDNEMVQTLQAFYVALSTNNTNSLLIKVV